MTQYAVLNKTDLNEFISRLAQIKKTVAPVKRGVKNYAFEEVTSGKDISLKYIPTILPPKKYFLPQTETLQQYDKSKKSWNAVMEFQEMIIFGVHTCDLAGIQCLNMVFSDKPKDINYLARKNRILIIGLECNEYCDEYASCKVMDNHLPNGGYDLFFTELDDFFMVHINTLEGEELIEKTGLFKEAKEEHKDALKALRQVKREIFKDEVNVSHNKLKNLFDRSFESPVWQKLQEKCVSCGNCTNVCPTCYCFDIEDEIDLNLTTGLRKRRWDSCQSESFASVAGGENFREERGDRQRHRYMRKFKYPVDKYSRYFCTGCGRCSRTCMAQINLKETVDQLAEGEK